MPPRIVIPRFLCLALALLVLLPSARAQWLTQSFDLEAGWNAVFLHVDASHDTLDSLVGGDPANPIVEVWRWNPPGTLQFVEDPQFPSGSDSEWSSWVAGQTNLGLNRLVGDSAYLVKVATNGAPHTWNLKGRPVPPRSTWSVSGLNFIGFPTVPNTPPNFEDFLAESPELQSVIPEVYYYPGGDLGPGNPQLLNPVLFRNMDVVRGEGYWVRSGEVFNRYFGPYEVLVSTSTGISGVDFGDSLSTYSFRLRNLTVSPLTVTLQLENSETEPAGEVPVAGAPPLLLRGNLNPTNLTYGYTNLPVGGSESWTLAARDEEGSEVVVVLGLDRSVGGGNVGDFLAAILRFTDSLDYSRVDVPVSATVASSAGLWVGGAAVTQVGQYLKSFARGASDPLIVTNANNVITNDLLISTSGQYVVTNLNTDITDAPSFFPLRLIVHNPGTGSARLMQRVYFGFDALTNPIVANQEASLNANFLGEARRISTVHLPWAESNPGWSFNGQLGQGANVTTSVTTDFDDHASNPFLHTYHPDHDNLDASFAAPQDQGVESYTIVRDITLTVTPPLDDFSSRTGGGLTLTGDYLETIRMLGLGRGGGPDDTRQFEVRGVFSLTRISDVSTLSVVP